MLHPGPLSAEVGALEVALEPGASPALDEAAAAAGPEHAFLRAAWFAAAAGDAPLATLCARRFGTGAIVAALPLVPRRLGPISLREVPGSYWPYRSFPIAADATDVELAALLASPEARSAMGRAWRLGPVHADDPTALHLAAAARRSGWTLVTRRVATCFVLDLARIAAAGRWPSSRRRQTLRRRERWLAEHGEVTVSTIRGGEWSPAELDRLAGIESRSWVAREAGLKDAKFLRGSPARAVWESAVADPALAEKFVCWLLEVGGEPAAFVFCLDAGSTRHVVANGYRESFANGSPGLILLFRCFADSVAQGVEKISWGAGDTGYKSDMGAEPGPEMLDLLFVRGALLAKLARPLWRRGF